MAEPRVIPLTDQRHAASLPSAPVQPPSGLLTDTRGRPLRDLRISVTDRCNFRCSYCMPKDVFGKDYPYLPHSALLSFEEITRLAQQFLAHGVRKIRLTGFQRVYHPFLGGINFSILSEKKITPILSLF